MAIRFIDGFDHYATADVLKKWTQSSSDTTYSIGAHGRFSSQGIRFTDSQYIAKVLGPAQTFVLGFAFRPTTINGDRKIAAFWDGTSSQVELTLKSNGTLAVTRNGTALTGGTSTVTLSVGVFVYIEWKVTISSSIAASSNVVRVSGVSAITVATSQNTQNTANATADTVVIGSQTGGSGYSHDYDDLYVLDTTGSANNDFIGDMRVEAIWPTGAGNTTDFAHTGAASNWAAVSETAEDGDTSYVSSASAGDKDTYAMGDLSSTPVSIAAVQVVLTTRKDDAGTRLAAAVVRSGGTDYTGSSFGVSDSYSMNLTVFENNPNTSAAWTGTDVDGMEAGVTLVV